MVVQELVQVYQTSTALARQVKSDRNIKLGSLNLQIPWTIAMRIGSRIVVRTLEWVCSQQSCVGKFKSLSVALPITFCCRQTRPKLSSLHQKACLAWSGRIAVFRQLFRLRGVDELVDVVLL
jgi:hypothetical protein